MWLDQDDVFKCHSELAYPVSASTKRARSFVEICGDLSQPCASPSALSSNHGLHRLLQTTLLHKQYYPQLFTIVLFASLASLWIRRRRAARLANPEGLPYPPGPKPLPIIGNLLDLFQNDLFGKFDDWGREYGDLVHLNIMGRHFVFVNSYKVSNELFDKRSNNYSDRNPLPMINGLMGWDWAFGHMAYNERWKASRKMFHKEFQASAISKQFDTHIRAAHRLLRHTFIHPEEFIEHLKYHAGSTIMKVVYDLDIAQKNDQYIITAESALESMALAAESGRFLVDLLPWLRHVPEWVPGAGFKRLARQWKATVLEMRDAPFEATKNYMSQGTAAPCFVSTLLGNLEHTRGLSREKKEMESDIIRGCAGMAYAAATESTVSSLHSLILAMVLHPDVQRRAQAELDSVLHKERLPNFSDHKSLPYTDAMVKELIRWAQVAPLALPHMITKDDSFSGYFLKAGTTIVGNTRMILHDERTYKSPHEYKPERFLSHFVRVNGKKEDSAPLDICPGRFMADAQIWIVLASVLSVFDISLPKGAELPKVQFTPGMISHPVPFKFQIVLRGDFVRDIIEGTEE